MLRKILGLFALPLLLLLGNSSGNSAPHLPGKSPEGQTGTLEKMIVANGNVAMDVDLNRLNGTATSESKLDPLGFQVGPNSFFTVLLFDGILRGPDAGSMGLVPQNTATLPAPLQASLTQLVIEKLPSDASFDLAVRDGKTGFVFFNIDGNLYEYDAAARLLTIKDGKLLISEEFAKRLGRPADAGTSVGRISITAKMYLIETTTLVNGAAQSACPAAFETRRWSAGSERLCRDPMSSWAICLLCRNLAAAEPRSASELERPPAITETVDLNWFALPNTDHPVIPQNLYRMSGGATNDDRFEQIGQSWLKHAFTALTENACSFGCNGTGGTHLGVGCSDPVRRELECKSKWSWFARFRESLHRRLPVDGPGSQRPHSFTAPRTESWSRSTT